ncbi:MAG: AmmeMemoRadiSam system radical SAM enzyme [Thermoproteota archaeon]|nr:MAG: AmmeMemoRadiSam system radical SAM enzyme [Candidatus Korarchaeota archaeon]
MIEPCPEGREDWVIAALQEPLEDGKVKCLACPRYCVIPEGKRGACRSKINLNGRLCEVNFGKVSSVAMDPIEKKPLFHYYPGSWAYSIGTVGCNLMCEHCQNWEISQSDPLDFPWLQTLMPEEAVNGAKRAGALSIAFTYNEPTIVNLKWVVETSKLAKKEGIKTLSITNGYWSKETRELLAPLIDAANVDVKAFTDEFYREVCKASSLKPVLETVLHLKKSGVHVELTYLVIPGLNDGEDEIRSFARWVVEEVGSDTPVHFSRFYPHYKMRDRPPTPIETVDRAREIAIEEGVKYVYTGNVLGDPGENTYCPSCGELLIKRYGFDVLKCNLLEGNTCPKCGEPIAIIGRCTTRGWRFL